MADDFSGRLRRFNAHFNVGITISYDRNKRARVYVQHYGFFKFLYAHCLVNLRRKCFGIYRIKQVCFRLMRFAFDQFTLRQFIRYRSALFGIYFPNYDDFKLKFQSVMLFNFHNAD